MPLATIEDLANMAKSLAASDASVPLAAQWVNTRIAEVAGQRRLRFYRRLKELYTPATYTTGTCTVERDSVVVAGSLTVWDPTHEEWFFRAGVNWYRVESVFSGTVLHLASPYAEQSITGSSYVLVKRFHALDPDVRAFSDQSFTHGRTGQPLQVITQEELNMSYPSRYYGAGGLARVLAEAEPHYSGARQVELFPYASTSELYYYLAWVKPEPLELDDPIPSFINPYALLEGIKADMLFYKASRATEPTMAQILFNEHRRQVTHWHGKIQEALLQEPGIDDRQFVVQSLKDRRGLQEHGIYTAYDQVWSRS